MERTYFATPERSGKDDLEMELALASSNMVIDGVLKIVGGLLAVLNDKRQIIAVNDYFVQQLGVTSIEEIFGLRLGEVIGCIHAEEDPAGCGTTKYCSSCGAAIAMVASLAENKPVEEVCIAEVRQDNLKKDLYMQVRAVPFRCDGQRFILIFLQDNTRQKQWAHEERVFFHDLKNLLCALQGAAELVITGSPEISRNAGRLVRRLVRRLNTEIELQKTLSFSEEHIYHPSLEDVSVAGILLDIQEEYSGHPTARNKEFLISTADKPLYLLTDSSVLIRVLGNMVVNALEATEPGGHIQLEAKNIDGDTLRFSVWNKMPIPVSDQLHIFQRNFSTKGIEGRGLGTWSMKFFGEKILGGRVDFTSSEQDGTRFFLDLPLHSRRA